MYDTIEIANRIKQRTKQQHKTLREVLESSDLSINTISNIKKGQGILYLNFARIADELDCSVDYLLGRTDNPEINR